MGLRIQQYQASCFRRRCGCYLQSKNHGYGFKNPDFNSTILMSVADTWQKQSGKWKALCSANVPRQPLPNEVPLCEPLLRSHQMTVIAEHVLSFFALHFSLTGKRE